VLQFLFVNAVGDAHHPAEADPLCVDPPGDDIRGRVEHTYVCENPEVVQASKQQR
jgi:hypothetical protein